MTGGAVQLSISARTDVGIVREHNEDNFLVADLTRTERASEGVLSVAGHGVVMVVCDGMGGAAAGEIASQMAIDSVFEELVDSRSSLGRTPWSVLVDRLSTAVEAASVEINDEALRESTRRGMGTTLTAGAVVDQHLCLAQVGDSRGYVLRNEVLYQVTRDQSLVGKLLEAGMLTEAEVYDFEHANVILQALGALRVVQVDVGVVKLSRGDRILLCSDGLSGLITDEMIGRELASNGTPEEIAARLIELAKEAGGHDNITVIVAFVDGTLEEADPHAPLQVLSRNGEAVRPPPLPDPRNLLAAYAPLIGGRQPTPSPVPEPTPLPSVPPAPRLPNVDQGGGDPSSAANGLGYAGEPMMMMAPRVESRAVIALVMLAALLSIATAGTAAFVALSSITPSRADPGPPTPVQAPAEHKGWISVTTPEPAAPMTTSSTSNSIPPTSSFARANGGDDPRRPAVPAGANSAGPRPTAAAPNGPAAPGERQPAGPHPSAGAGSGPRVEPPPLEDYP